jgi:FlaA1/EpsC-like NDP-sugar epimerase
MNKLYKKMLSLINKLMKDRYLPSWVIILIDFGICVFAAFVSGFILGGKEKYFNFPLDSYSARFLILSIVLTTSFLILFKVAKGVIRYSTFSDAMRIFFAVVFSCLLMLLINLTYKYKIDPLEKDFIPKQLILIYFFVCYIGLFLFRMFVRWLFEKAYKAGIHISMTTSIIIFGAGRTGTATANTMMSASRKYYIKGFFDDEESLSGKSIMGFRIWGRKDFERILSYKDIDELVIATNRISTQRKNEIFDLCYKNKIKVLTVPHIKTWTDGELKVEQIKEIEIEQLLNREEIKLNVEIISREIEGKTIMVTGAAGSIGSEIIRQLTHFNPKLICVLDQAETSLYNIENELNDKYSGSNYKIIICSVQDKERLEDVFKHIRPDIVFHAAAYKHVPMMEAHPYEAVRVNVFGTKNIADLSSKYGVKKFVMISTDKAVNPTNVMGATKRFAEIYIQSLDKTSQTQFITTRFGNVLGSNGSVIPRFRQQIQKGGPVTVTHPDIIRYFMTIPEACRLVLEAGVMGKGGEIFLFDMGEPVRIVDLAKRMIKLSNLELDQDIKIEFTGLRPGEKLYEELLNQKEHSLPTYHKKIFVAKNESFEMVQVDKSIEELEQECHNQDEDGIVRVIKSLVSNFKSNNSRFEKLDAKE